MITPTDMVPHLLEACPTAKERWTKHLEYWGDDERGIYIDLSEFAHHLIETSTIDSSHSEIRSFFALLERFFTDGDPKVQEFAAIGLVEDIQNIASHQPNGFAPFEAQLGPRSKRASAEVIRMWDGKTNLMDVVRDERQQPPSS